MTVNELIIQLSKNQQIIASMLSDIPPDFSHFKKDDQSWSPLIIICHLVDEEIEDFRARIQHFSAHPETSPPPIDPEGWVISRAYEQQDFESKLREWLSERSVSLKYLETLNPDDYTKGFDHPHFGRFTVEYLMDNWLAHDILHIRQLTRIRYHYLSAASSHSIEYAGKW